MPYSRATIAACDMVPPMSDTATPVASDPVKQFSVFIENRVGRLFDLVALLRREFAQDVGGGFAGRGLADADAQAGNVLGAEGFDH